MQRLFAQLGLACFFLLSSWGAAQEPDASSNVVATTHGGGASAFHINSFLGADRFYDAGFTGQGTITANVEAGFIWNGHEALAHVNRFSKGSEAFSSSVSAMFDRHATWVGMMIGGRATPGGGAYQTGIAPGTDLRSGAIASSWTGSAYSLSFGFTANSFTGGYQPFFGTADVINSSWGSNGSAGNSFFAIAGDGFAAQNPHTTFVASAGNSGAGNNTVGSPGSGYNAITVGAVAAGSDNSFDSIASFSSRGAQDYADPVRGTVVGVRAAVDLVAPGTNLQSAFYGGQSGGNHSGLSGSVNSGSNASAYSNSVAGTSLAAPIVAGGVALLKSASYNTPELAANAASRDTLVVKSILQNSADKTVGWNNGQVANAAGGVTTTQALDYAAGAGRMNLDRAFDQFLTAGTRDVIGLGRGNLGTVSQIGWDLGNVLLGGTNLYTIDGLLSANSLMNVTLNWFRNRTYDPVRLVTQDLGQANLTLRVVDLVSNAIISESASLYNTTEHLSFALPTSSTYGIQVLYADNLFGSMTNVNYGLAWSVSTISAVPEPAAVSLLLVLASGLGVHTYRARRARSN